MKIDPLIHAKGGAGSAPFSEAVGRIQLSASNAASQRARELRAAGRTIINLTLGEPDFDTPDHIKQAAIAAIQSGATKYTTIDGTAELKAAIVQKFNRDNQLSFEPTEISVSAGAKQTVFNALVATLNMGDEVIVPAPYWVSYPEMVSLVGGRCVTVKPASGDLKIRPEELAAAITPRTRWIILNSPNNPSGTVYSREELRALLDVVAPHQRIWIMSDDIYEHIIFGGREFVNPANVAPELRDRILTINGVSKAYAMTGWRLGFAAGPQTLIRQMAKVQSQSTSNPSSISQAAAAAALSGPQNIVNERRAEFERRAILMSQALSEIPDVDCPVPDGAFFVFPDFSAYLGRKTESGNLVSSDLDLARYLLEVGGVATVHGDAYGLPGRIRFSFAASDEQLRAGCAQVKDALARLVR